MKKFKRFVSMVLCVFMVTSVLLIGDNAGSKVQAAANLDVLKLTVENDGSAVANKFSYIDFSDAGAGTYTFAAGDYIEYDVKIDGNYSGAGGLEIECTDGSNFRDTGWMDQNGLGGHPGTELSSKAAPMWYHRKLQVPSSRIGKKISRWQVAGENDSGSFVYSAYYDNIQVTNGSGSVKLNAYTDGAPGLSSLRQQQGTKSCRLISKALSFEKGSPQGDVLKFVVNNSSSGSSKYVYWEFSNAGANSYTFAAGDYIEYDVKLSSASDTGAGGIEIVCTDGSSFRGSGWTDQRNLSGHPAADLTGYADNSWYHRKLAVPSQLVGKTLSRWNAAGENDENNKSYTVYYDNIKVTNGSTNKLPVYSEGNPALNVVDPSGGMGNIASVELSKGYVDESAAAGEIMKFTVVNDSTTTNDQKLGTTGRSGKLAYVNFSNSGSGTYTLAGGDYIEYDVKVDGAIEGAGGIDILFTDGTSCTDSNVQAWADQNSCPAEPRQDLSRQAGSKWYHRKIKIPVQCMGKTISKWQVVGENKRHGLAYTAFYDNVVVTDGAGTVKLAAFTNGSPVLGDARMQQGVISYKLSSCPAYSMKGNPGGDILSLEVKNSTSGTNKYAYWEFSNAGAGSYTFAAGDCIEYDVRLFNAVDYGAGGIEIYCTDGSSFRGSGWYDQHGINGHPVADITAYSDNRWYHRKLQVPSALFGKVISRWDLVGENDENGKSYAANYDNIVVTDGNGNVKLSAYSDGNPSLNTVDPDGGMGNANSVILSKTAFTSDAASPGGDVLRLFAANASDMTVSDPNSITNKYTYWKFSNAGSGTFSFAAGDFIEYDVKINEYVQQLNDKYSYGGGGIDVKCTDGTYFRDQQGWKDQNNLSGHPASDITKYASGVWYHRKMAVPQAVIGKTVDFWDLAGESNVSNQVYNTSYDNIKVTNAGNTRLMVYDNGNPSLNEQDTIAGRGGVITTVLTSEPSNGLPVYSPRTFTISLASDDIIAASYNVMDFGAARDGTTDDTYAFQKALYAADRDGGAVVFAPAGQYAIRGHLVIPSGVTLRGEWKNPDNGGLGQGTILKAYENRNNENGVPFIALALSSGVRDLSIWYPEQSYSTVYPYPWTIENLAGENESVLNVTLINPYKGIKIGPQWNELHYIKNVYGTPLRQGAFIDWTTDIGRMENVHFEPKYWSQSGLAGSPAGTAEQTLRAYTSTYGEGIVFGRSDWEFVYNVSLKAYSTGMRFMLNTDGWGLSSAQMYGLNIDEGQTGLLIQGVNEPGIEVSNSTIKASVGSDPVAIKFANLPGGYEYVDMTARFNTCTIGGAPNTGVRLVWPGTPAEWNMTMTFQNCTFTDWGYQGGTYAVDAQSGTVTFEGCTFQQNKKHIKLASAVKAAAILGNTFTGSPQIDNYSTNDIKIDHSPYNFEQMGTEMHAYRPSVPKPSSSNFYNVKAAPYNAKGDGATDDTGAIQSALNAAQSAGGGTVYLPAGTYRINGNLSVAGNVELRGIWDVPHNSWKGGSVLYACSGKGNANGTPLITLAANAGVRGLTIYYPEQDFQNVQAYPWAIRGNGTGVYALYIDISNSYQGVDFGTNNCGGHYLEYVSGSPLCAGIFAGNSSSEGWVQNTHFNPNFWQRSSFPNRPDLSQTEADTLVNYQLNNCDAMKIGYCANEHLLNNFVYAAKYGIHFVSQAGGKPNAKVFGHGSDNCTKAVYVEDAGTNGIKLVNTMLTSCTNTSIITCASTVSNPVKFFNTVMWGTPSDVIEILGGTVLIQSGNMMHIGTGCSGIKATGGTLTVDNMYFMSNIKKDNIASKTHVYAGAGITGMKLTGCIFTDMRNVTNQAGSKYVELNNVLRIRTNEQ